MGETSSQSDFSRSKGVLVYKSCLGFLIEAPEAPFVKPWRSKILKMLQCDMPLSDFVPQKFMKGLGGDPICSWMLLVHTLNI